jgi:hypothetical protein
MERPPKAGSSRAQVKGLFEGSDSANGGRGATTATSAIEQEGENFVWLQGCLGKWFRLVH